MKMKIDIWSDIMCPFCYIGKRRFEQALDSFPAKDQVEVEWHSFQLDPSAQYSPGRDVYTYLAERKGQSRAWAMRMHEQVTEMARQEGLEYRFDQAVVANSFDAHRLIQLAKKHGLGDAAEERLFKAYFTEGMNISDEAALIGLGKETGLAEDAIKEMLYTDEFAKEVRNDVHKAASLGINGVPFFVINGKLGVSGAQSPATFTAALQQGWEAFRAEHPALEIISAEAPACSPDGCEQ